MTAILTEGDPASLRTVVEGHGRDHVDHEKHDDIKAYRKPAA